MNSCHHLFEQRCILSFLVDLLDGQFCSCYTLCKLYLLQGGYDYLRFHRVVGFLSLSGFIVQMVFIGFYCFIVQRIDTFCILLCGYQDILSLKITQEKSTKFTKTFELHQVFMYNFQCQNVWIFPNYILHTRKTNKFWEQKF